MKELCLYLWDYCDHCKWLWHYDYNIVIVALTTLKMFIVFDIYAAVTIWWRDYNEKIIMSFYCRLHIVLVSKKKNNYNSLCGFHFCRWGSPIINSWIINLTVFYFILILINLNEWNSVVSWLNNKLNNWTTE